VIAFSDGSTSTRRARGQRHLGVTPSGVHLSFVDKGSTVKDSLLGLLRSGRDVLCFRSFESSGNAS
jgi:hypothetical protein